MADPTCAPDPFMSPVLEAYVGWARDHCTGGTRGVGMRPLYGRHTWGGHETTVREAHVGWARDHCTGGTRGVGTRPLYGRHTWGGHETAVQYCCGDQGTGGQTSDFDSRFFFLINKCLITQSSNQACIIIYLASATRIYLSV